MRKWISVVHNKVCAVLLRLKRKEEANEQSVQEDLRCVEALHDIGAFKNKYQLKGLWLRGILQEIKEQSKNDKEAHKCGYKGREICKLPDELYIKTKNEA